MPATKITRNKSGKRARDHERWTTHDAAVPPGHKIQSPASLPVAGYLRWKGLADRMLAAVLIVPGLLVIGLLMALVRLTSRGPGLFRQTRVGRNGRIFTLYKIRTMVKNAEEASGAVWCKVNDMRITPLGKVLRKLHFDEFPQLFNVFKGDMSLVGPRPERPEFVDVLAEAIPDYRKRLAVLPGITGLAQLNLPPDTDHESVRRKLSLDLEYIEHVSLPLDLRLLVATAFRLIKFPEFWALKILRLRRVVKLPPLDKPPVSGSGQKQAIYTPNSAHLARILEKAGGDGKTKTGIDEMLRDTTIGPGRSPKPR
jgi:lipopolysaccharide/colanic/teichoic acid biosynthesis glycosyltransferase